MKFGDKIFIYGQYMLLLEEMPDNDYNTVIGYITVGGYSVYPIESEVEMASIPGFVIETSLSGSLAFETPFVNADYIDVTEKLSRQIPMLDGSRVWMPTMGPL